MELGNYGEAIELINRATQYCTKKTGYYVYYSLSRVYDQLHDRLNRIRSLRKALEYDPKRTIARHSLGVALSQSGNFDEALDIFEEIIREELSRSDGPSESLAYAYKTQHGKTSTLKTKWHTSRSIQVARCGHANREVSGMQ